MAPDRSALEELLREELVVEARRVGVTRPEVMTRVELVDEILRVGTPNPVTRKQVRGWLGVARDLIASVVEQGLNLPDAAALIRGDIRFEPLRTPQPPVATVTLAEIYGAQGHYGRALGILDEVLKKEPDHAVAGRLRDKIASDRDKARGDAPRVPPDPTVEPDVQDEAAADAPDLPTLPPLAPDEPDAPTLFPPRPFVLDESEAKTLYPPRRAEPAPAAKPNGTGMPGMASVILARPDPTRVALYYELDTLRARGSDVLVLVRVVELRPRPSGAERVERDLAVDGASGTLVIDGVEADAVVRAALGTKEADTFRAVAVAAEMRVSPEGAEVVWAPGRSRDYAAFARRAALLLPLAWS